MSTHARISPSKLGRVIACPASLSMSERYPSIGASPYATEGTLLHGKVERYIQSGGTAVLAGLTEEQLDAVIRCQTWFNATFYGVSMDEFFFEKRVTLAPYGITDAWGTCDVCGYDAKSKVLHIVDWKFGKGVPVMVEENAQLMTYALGAMLLFPHGGEAVHLHVVQPRRDYYGTWETTRGALQQWFHNRLYPAIKDALGDNPTFNPGTEQCRWCSAAGLCEARQEQMNHMAAHVFEAVAEIDGDAAVDKLVAAYAQLDALMGAVKEVRAAATRLAMQDALPGYKVVQGKKRRTWAVSREELESWLVGHGIEPYERKPLSVARVEKIIGKGLLDDMITVDYGEPVIVQEDDKRAALDAKTVFASFSDPFEPEE